MCPQGEQFSPTSDSLEKACGFYVAIVCSFSKAVVMQATWF